MSLGQPLQDMYHSKDDVSVTFLVDDTFTGIMQGATGDEGEGCTLSGQCVLQVQRPIKVSRLSLFFEGRCKVHLKKANSYGMTSLSGTGETRSLYSMQQDFLGQDGETHALKPGVYSYQFSFDLPSHLPASFQGSRGYIRYRLTCVIYRSMFSTDLRTSMDITLKRCLISDLELPANGVETVHGTKHTSRIQYSGTATAMAYREGGQIRLNLAIQLRQPGHDKIKSITCALRERVQYRTTDSQSRTMVTRSDDSYPLGYNSFFPDQSPGYDPTKHQNYNALLHLIPRVNADTSCRLIQVTHSLVVKIMLQQLDGDDNHALDEINENYQHHQSTDEGELCDSLAPNYSNCCQLEQSSTLSEPSVHQHGIITPSSSSLSNPTTPPPLSLLKSIFSLKKGSDSTSLSPKSKASQIRGQQCHCIVVCTLEIPIVVTSRYNASKVHNIECPPSYLQAASERVPEYQQSLESCPTVPTYRNNSEQQLYHD